MSQILPNEIIREILCYLPAIKKIKMSGVSKDLYILVKSFSNLYQQKDKYGRTLNFLKEEFTREYENIRQKFFFFEHFGNNQKDVEEFRNNIKKHVPRKYRYEFKYDQKLIDFFCLNYSPPGTNLSNSKELWFELINNNY